MKNDPKHSQLFLLVLSTLPSLNKEGLVSVLGKVWREDVGIEPTRPLRQKPYRI